MSTILDALKRLEDNDRGDGANHASLTLRGRSAPANRPRWRLVGFAGLTILVVGGAVVFWFFPMGQDHTPVHHNTFPEKQTMAAAPERNVQPSPTAENPASSRAAGERGGGDKADPRPLQSETPMADDRSGLRSPNYVPPSPDGFREQAIPSPIAVAPTSRTATESQAPYGPSDLRSSSGTTATQPTVPPPNRQDPYARVEVLSDDKLQLQAISWSDIPSARITIIAGNILRQGQNVDGYNVVEIRSNDVIVEKAGKRWRLVYGGQ